MYANLCIAQSRYGLGLPLDDRPAVNIDIYSTLNYAGRPFYQVGIAAFKIALCLAYIRITGRNIHHIYRYTIWATLVFTLASHITGALVLIRMCQPVSKSWRPGTPGKCLPSTTTFYALAAVSIFCDILVMLLPVPLLVRLQINMRRKVGLLVIFTLGIFTTICSGMRMAQIRTIAENGNSTMLVLWGVVELNVGIILSSLPALNPILVRCLGKVNSDRSKDSSRLKTDVELRTGKMRSGRQSSREADRDVEGVGTTSPPRSTHMLTRQDDQEMILTFSPASTPDSKDRKLDTNGANHVTTPQHSPSHSLREVSESKNNRLMHLNVKLNEIIHNSKQTMNRTSGNPGRSRLKNRESVGSQITISQSGGTQSIRPDIKLGGSIVKTMDVYVEKIGGM